MRQSNLTRKELAKIINEKMGFSQRSAEGLVQVIFSTLKETLISGEPVKLVRFGTLAVRKKASRQGRNPRTGEPLEITRRKMVTFKPSKGLRTRVNNRKEE